MQRLKNEKKIGRSLMNMEKESEIIEMKKGKERKLKNLIEGKPFGIA